MRSGSPRGDRHCRLSWTHVCALWGSQWGKEETGLWEDLQLTVLWVDIAAWAWTSEGDRLGVTGAVCSGKAVGLRTPRWVSSGLAGAGSVLLFRRMAAPTERKVPDPQGVLGVADAGVGGLKPGKSAQLSPAFAAAKGDWEGPAPQGACFLGRQPLLVLPTIISSVCVCFLFLPLQDIVTIGMLSLPCGWLCTTIGLPTMFGYIICGVLLGPSGLNSIKVRAESNCVVSFNRTPKKRGLKGFDVLNLN